jgi:hypothetical protein
MAIEIPSEHKTIYNDTINALIDSVYGIDCSMKQPFTKTDCPNCLLNTMSNTSSGQYKAGGPVAFEDGQICPYCNGVGYIESQVANTVRMLIYWDASQWAKENGITIKFPDGLIVSKGKMASYKTVESADSMVVHNDIPTLPMFKYRRWGEMSPFGIGKDSFFVAYWQRS